MKPEGTITYTVDRTYDVSEIQINDDGWYKVSVRLWPISNRMRSNCLNLHRTPVLYRNRLFPHLMIVVSIQHFCCFFVNSTKNEQCSKQLQNQFDKKH